MASCCCFESLTIPAIGFILIGIAGSRYHLSQKIQNTATSKIRGVAVGLVELKGKARLKDQTNSGSVSPSSSLDYYIPNAIVENKNLVSPISGRKCAYYKISFSCKGTHLFTMRQKLVSSFYLDDGTGKVLVKSKWAEIDLHNKRITKGYLFDKDKSGKPLEQFDERILKYVKGLDEFKGEALRTCAYNEIEITETCIADGDEIYVIGNAEPIENAPKSALSHERLVIKMGGFERIMLISDKHENQISARLIKDALIFFLLGLLVLGYWAFTLLYPKGITITL